MLPPPCPMVGTMLQPPWNARIYRNRHGRGTRTPMFGTVCPVTALAPACSTIWWRPRSQARQAWPELIRPLQFAVEDVPPSDPTPWQTEPNMTSQCFPASHGIPARVVLYRMPLQTEAPTKLELQLAVRDELVARIAELYGAGRGNRPRLGPVTTLRAVSLVIR